MKAEEFEKLITFSEHRLGSNTVVEAKLTVHSAMSIANAEIEGSRLDRSEVMKWVHRELTEIIMRRVYDDQRDRFMTALMNLFAASPMDMEGMHKAKDDLLTAATRQKPEKL